MDAQLLDDDPDAAAMAEAMGFTGFGSQRPAKRKFNANADAAVSSSEEKRGGNVSKTGANNAPLGVRRPLQLPLPSNSPSELPNPMALSVDAEEVAPGEDEHAAGGEGLDATAFHVTNKFIDTLRTPGGYQSEDADSMVAQPPGHRGIDEGPPGLPSRPSHPQSLQHAQKHQRGRGGRGGGTEPYPVGETGVPWWEGYFDARMNENPWEKLERERCLQPRGMWIARSASHLPATAAAPLVLSTSTVRDDESDKAAFEKVDGAAAADAAAYSPAKEP